MVKIDTSSISQEPGCYLFKNSSGTIIYIGKAKNLKKRVTSYFAKKDQDPKTQALVRNIDSVDFIITKNEIEALILENNLIKKHKPRYNIDLKDSKSYTFIELTDEEFPRFVVARIKNKKTKARFGPFTSAKSRDDILYVINRIFKLKTCIKLPKKACLRYPIGLCSAPCINQISKIDYNDHISLAKKVLKGDIKNVIEILNEKMKNSSRLKQYERAINFREQIKSLEYLVEKQNVARKRTYNEDIINYIEKENKVYLIVFNIYKGILENKQEFVFEKTSDFIEEFLIQFYSENNIPKEIILPEELDKSIEEYLTLKKNAKVSLVLPIKGEKKELLELVKKNIEISFFGDIEKLEILKRILNLNEIPCVIECFDISHLSGTNIVASMVQFRSAKPDKSNYRRFKIRTVNQNDDFASIAEVVKRRYTKLKNNHLEFPNLIVIDGGKGQLSSALNVLKSLNIKIPIISLAKEFEEIYVPGESESIKLSEKNSARLLLQEIRDEAHRFAIKYNRLLRRKEIRG